MKNVLRFSAALVLVASLSSGCKQAESTSGPPPSGAPPVVVPTTAAAPSTNPQVHAPSGGAPTGEREHDQGRAISGKVVEKLDAASYSYLRIQTPAGEIWAAVPTAKTAVGAEVTVLAHDGGDGLSAIKIWLAKGVGPHIPAAPIPITKEQPTAVQLTLPPTTCDQVLVVACNAGGQICSKPVQVPFCPKKKHKLPAKTAG